MSENVTITSYELHAQAIRLAPPHRIDPKNRKATLSSSKKRSVSNDLQSLISGRFADKKPAKSIPNLEVPRLTLQQQHISSDLWGAPTLPANHIPRPRLLEKLAAHDGTLIQLVAPAGYGKTCLAAEWVRSRGCHQLWISFGQGDDRPNCFWQHFAQAIDLLLPGAGIAALQMLTTPFADEIETVVALLCRDVRRVADERFKQSPIFLVIDDFHWITNPEIHRQLLNFLNQLSPQFQMMILSRRELVLSESDLAMTNPVVLRYSDLAFTATETLEYFQKSTYRPATLANATEIARFFEGWVAGLQLIAAKAEAHPHSLSELLYMKNQAPLIPYLMRQTFDSAPYQQQIFMLCSALFSEFTPAMTDWICKEELNAALSADVQSETSMTQPALPSMCNDSREIIASLQQLGCFIYPCVENGDWYRYHPLFAEMLREEFRKRFPDKECVLRDRSQLWYLRQSVSPGK